MTARAQPLLLEIVPAEGLGSSSRARRGLAVLAGISAALHIMMLGHGSFWLSIMMAALAFGCLFCAGRLWRGPSPRTLGMTAMMNASMVVIHLVMMASAGTHSVGVAAGVSISAHHGGAATVYSGILPLDHPGLMITATAIAVAEVLGAVWMSRRGSERGVVREGDD
ncbi:hypothetical protein [Nesterenkonia lutea]|uniref:Uncharacterized protein n=1 Tax=Nesterenkonia lutea TaxID=272919 RepID=A0ABR9JGU0_9MICC|nr:hypothetical protein [Nesterenkonia lutea]MBE1525145.1 hypothetical protein [Nesterenkonia lutea]